MIASDGTTIFGEITEDTGLITAPIKLSEGYADEHGDGYGLKHIEARRGKQIRDAGFASVEDFVKYVARNYDKKAVKVGKKRVDGAETFIIQIQDKKANILYIELSKDNSYWNVNSGGIFRKDYVDKKENVGQNTELSASAATTRDESFAQTAHNDNSEAAVAHGDTQHSSDGKDTNIPETSNNQEVKSPENSGNNVERFIEGKSKMQARPELEQATGEILRETKEDEKLLSVAKDEELKKFNELYEAYTEANDRLGEAQERLEKAKLTKDKKTIEAAKKKTAVKAFKPLEDFYKQLTEKYDLHSEERQQVDAVQGETKEETKPEQKPAAPQAPSTEKPSAKKPSRNYEEMTPEEKWEWTLQNQGTIEGKAPKVTKPAVSKFKSPSPRDPRSALRGVYHDGGYEVASDGCVLVAVRSQYDASLEGKITTDKGEEIQGRYPKWRSFGSQGTS